MFFQEMLTVYIAPVALAVVSLLILSSGMGILGEIKVRISKKAYNKPSIEEKASYYNKKKIQEGIAS